MTYRKKLCFEHGKNFKNQDSYVCVMPDKCELCKLEKTFDKVLDMPEFRDLRP